MNKKLIFSVVILVGVLALAWTGFSWWKVKQTQIKLGVASDKFPYRGYTPEELNKMYPQIKNADVLTRTTPEETYAKFREALRTNNLEMAIEQLSKESEKYGENKKTLNKFYQDNKFKDILDHYPDKINKVYMYEAIAQYEYNYFSPEYKQELTGDINFIKDSNGDWKIDIL